MRENTPHDTPPIHSIDHVPKTCWTCIHWEGGDVANHLCDLQPGRLLMGLTPCKDYALWEEWLYVEWFYPQRTRKANREL